MYARFRFTRCRRLLYRRQRKTVSYPRDFRGSCPGAMVSCARMTPFNPRICSSPPVFERMRRALLIASACVGAIELARVESGATTSH